MNAETTPKRWKRVLATGCKLIFCQPEMLSDVEGFIESEGGAVFDVEDHDGPARVDLGGMCLIDRDTWSTGVDGLPIEVPVTEFTSFLIPLSSGTPLMTAPSMTYYGLVGDMSIILLTDDQRRVLREEMLRDRDGVSARARVETARFSRGLEAVNRLLSESGSSTTVHSANAVPLSIPTKEWN